MRRVCCFCERWESGGIESFLYNILLHMDLSDMEVDIVAAQLGESVFTEALKECGIRFYELSGKLRTSANGRAFWALLEKRNYDVVHLNIFQGLSFHYGALARRAGIPVRIAHSHGAGLRNSPGKRLKLWLHERGKQLWSSSITDFWASSRCAAKFLFPVGQSYQWIPNGINVDRFLFQADGRRYVRQELGIGENTLLLGTVGRLSEEKNQGFLLEVFREVRTKTSDAVLLLVGAGRLAEEMRKKAEDLGVADSVIFYGESSRVPELLWAMDIFLFPSTTEGLGIAGVEAQAAGAPVLCSEHIPQEALITAQVTQLPLSAGPGAWAEMVLKMSPSQDRTTAAGKVSAAGYDVRAVAEKIRKAWME